MIRYSWVFLCITFVLGACTQRMVCPAYQSAFIYDKAELKKKFSYFEDDSMPKILTASKNKYLIAEPTSYRKKVRSLQTVAMREVPVKVPDSLSDDFDVSLAELDLAARSVMDTIMASGYQAEDTTQVEEDSVYVITKDKELRLLKYDADSSKYHVVNVRLNVDQDNYMWYLRDYLILPDVRLAKLQQMNGGESGKSAKAKKGERKGIRGFFANLFRKKKKEDSDTTELAPPPADEFDFVDTTAVDGAATPQANQEVKKKKGFFSFLKKKDKPADGDAPADKPKKEKRRKKKDAPPVEEEKKEEEEKDDGF